MLTRIQLAGLIALSSLSSALIVILAGGQTSMSQAQLLALLSSRPPIIHHLAPAAGATAPNRASASSAPAGAGATPAGGAPASTTHASSTTAASSTSPSAAGTATNTTAATTATPVKTITGKVKHVFVIALSTTSYGAAFGPRSAAGYLNHTLRPRGMLLSGYRSLAGAELPDYLAMISGQAANADTRANCPVYTDFPQAAKPSSAGLVSGRGCVYPNTVITLGDQVTASGTTWRGYLADMGKSACVHPSSGAHDSALLPFAGSQYDTRHNPFIYFHSLLDLGDCSTDDISLDALPAALKATSKAPRLSFIAPPLCDDAASTGCPGGKPGGIAGEDLFLKAWVPRIMGSTAYKHGGVLMIVFAPSRRSVAATSSAAAGATGASGATGTSGPSATSGATGATGPAAAPSAQAFTPVATSASATPLRTGALILSPLARRGRIVAGAFTPYSVLRSVEDLFGFKPLGHARGASSFDTQVLPGA
jgi:hypothetical protein